MTQPSRQPGWYPDPSDPSRNIYWDGSAWTVPAPTASNNAKKTGVAIGVVVLAVVGVILSWQSVSLMTGSGPVWTGVAVAAVAVALAFFLGAAKGIRVLAAVCLAVALVSAITIEKQLSDKRHEIQEKMSDIFNN